MHGFRECLEAIKGRKVLIVTIGANVYQLSSGVKLWSIICNYECNDHIIQRYRYSSHPGRCFLLFAHLFPIFGPRFQNSSISEMLQRWRLNALQHQNPNVFRLTTLYFVAINNMAMAINVNLPQAASDLQSGTNVAEYQLLQRVLNKPK